MNSKLTILCRLTATIVVLFGATSSRAQGEDPFSPDSNPYLRKKQASPSPSASVAAAAATVKLTDKDKNFMLKAATSGAGEIENGRVAQQKTQGAETKKIAARMVADHSKANKELVDLARKKGLAIDTGNIKGESIGGDKQYLTELEQAHKKDIAAFQRESQSGDDPEIKAWARKTLPTLNQHLAMVKAALSKAQ
jgi:putative membrane protein